MDPVNIEALSSMKTAVTGILPAPSGPDQGPDILITEARITPAGISGIIGTSTDPPGDIIGRHVNASIIIILRASSPQQLSALLDQHVTTLLSYGEGELRQAGILKLKLNKLEEAAQGPARGHIKVQVLYEHRKYPKDASDIIREIPIHLTPNSTS